MPSCLVVAPSSSTAQMPTKTKPDESAVEVTSVTAITGLSARSTESPQTRRKSRAKSLTLRGYLGREGSLLAANSASKAA